MERVEENIRLPAVLAPDSRQKRLALLAALLVPVPFIAIIPFGRIELPRVDSYIPVVDTVMLINDAIAATLVFAQFSILRTPSLRCSNRAYDEGLGGAIGPVGQQGLH